MCEEEARFAGTTNFRARNEASLIGKYASDNGVVATARSVLVSFPGQSLVFAKGIIFRETTIARNLNPQVITVIVYFNGNAAI